MADPVVYILVSFTQNDELGIGTLDSIAVPKDFYGGTFLHQLEQLKVYVGTKKIIGIKWPKYPISPGWSLPLDSTDTSRCSVHQYDMRSGKVITYSEDKDVVVSVRNAMMKNLIGVQKAVAKKSAPKLSATQKRGTGQNSTPPPPKLATKNSSTVSRKGMNIFDADLEGLDCQFITGGQEDKSCESDDSSFHVDDQKENLSSDSDDEDVIPPTPPLPPAKRKRDNQCDKSVSKTVAKRNSTHRKENDSFVTPNRCNKKSSANNFDSQVLTLLDVNIFDTPPCSTAKKGNPKLRSSALEQETEPIYTELQQQHLGGENNDESVNELKNQVSFLNEQIRHSTIELEIEREDYMQKMDEKDVIIFRLQEEIKSLKELNPEVLAKSLSEGLTLLQSTLETLTISTTQQQSLSQLERNDGARRINLVKLHKDFETTIHPNALATAISYGKAGSKKKDMSKIINIIMEALWDREFMSKHSLTGKKAPTDKTNNPAKPALPKEDVQAITSYIVEFWGTKHKLAIDPSMVYPCITSKLLSEHTAHKHREKMFMDNAEEVEPE